MEASRAAMAVEEPGVVNVDAADEKLRCSQFIPVTANIVGGLYFTAAVFWVLVGIVYQYFIYGLQDPKQRWSELLPDLGATPGRAIFMGVHFIGGMYLTVMGVFQVSPWSRSPERIHLHRLNGNIFVAMAVLTFLGGMGFLVQQVLCAGGLPMTISFGIYGFLVLFFSVMAWRRAKQRDFQSHREWAIRAFVFGIGSIIYRIMLGSFTMMGLIDPADKGLMEDPRLDRYFFQPWVRVAEWAFWVVPLLWTEWYLRAQQTTFQKSFLVGSSIFMGVCLVFFFLSP